MAPAEHDDGYAPPQEVPEGVTITQKMIDRIFRETGVRIHWRETAMGLGEEVDPGASLNN